MDEKTSYWLELAEYDLETARAMLKTRRLLYVGFMCHQTIEKALKAAISRSGDAPPHIHNLGKLAESSGLYSAMGEAHKDLLDDLEPLNIQARYPEDKDRVFRSLSIDSCAGLIRETEGLLHWIRATL